MDAHPAFVIGDYRYHDIKVGDDVAMPGRFYPT
jgi:hypothetical protein